jgi:hypothetical protein
MPPALLTPRQLAVELREAADCLDAGDYRAWNDLFALNIAELFAINEADDAAKAIEAWRDELSGETTQSNPKYRSRS